MVDAANLGAELLKAYEGEKSVKDALNAYNTEMIERGGKAVQESHDFAIMVHTHPELMLNKIRSSVFQRT